MFIFSQYNTYLYTYNEVSQLSEIMSEENMILSEQIQEYEKRLFTYEDALLEYENKIDDIEDRLSEVDKRVNNIKYNTPSTNGDIQNLYHGRLHIPSVGINVALYNSYKQYITDRVDSANIFTYEDCSKYTIADHKNQEFSKLYNVQIGMTGYIELKNGDVINIKCIDIFNGHNVVDKIIDEDGVDVTSVADYMMYTCLDNWRNVRICLWEIT